MGTITLGVLSVLFLVSVEAQNMTSATDIINSVKRSFEAAGAGAIKLGPMGVLGDMSGQFGIKVNKEDTSAAKAAAHAPALRGGRLMSALSSKEGSSISRKDMKSCGRRYGRPVIIPIIVSTTTAATTTTTAAAAR